IGESKSESRRAEDRKSRSGRPRKRPRPHNARMDTRRKSQERETLGARGLSYSALGCGRVWLKGLGRGFGGESGGKPPQSKNGERESIARDAPLQVEFGCNGEPRKRRAQVYTDLVMWS